MNNLSPGGTTKSAIMWALCHQEAKGQIACRCTIKHLKLFLTYRLSKCIEGIKINVLNEFLLLVLEANDYKNGYMHKKIQIMYNISFIVSIIACTSSFMFVAFCVFFSIYVPDLVFATLVSTQNFYFCLLLRQYIL